MKAVLFHTKEYGATFDSFATRPLNVVPEQVTEPQQHCADCVAVLITVEEGDDIVRVSLALAKEIAKMCRDVGRDHVVLIPFAHLSNKLATSKQGRATIERIEAHLKKEFTVTRAHFGSHKSLLLNVYGHPGNVRYREF